jgi:hypothetical protein
LIPGRDRTGTLLSGHPRLQRPPSGDNARGSGAQRPGEYKTAQSSPFLEISMLKKLVPAILGALLIAGPVLTVTTAAAAQAQTSTMKSHHKVTKKKTTKAWHKKSSHHMMKKHATAKKKTPPKA